MTATTAISSKYSTPQELAQFLAMEQVIPSIDATGSNRPKETVGASTGTATTLYLDNSRVINGSYTLSYGTAATATTDFTETADYTINLNNGTITLTATGGSKAGTANVYASYSYISQQQGLTNTQLQQALDRAESHIEYQTGQRWATSTEATPNYLQVTEEKHRGKGGYDKDYFLDKLPIPKVESSLTTAISAGSATVFIDDTGGFPASGSITIDSGKITYTGKTSTSLTGTTVSESHSAGGTAYPYVIEVSTTSSGTDPSWTVLAKGSNYDLDHDTGRVYLYNDDYSNNGTDSASMPPRLLPNRFRATYIAGQESIPDDIIKLTLTIAAGDITKMAVRKALVQGNDNFVPRIVYVDAEWVKSMLDKYTASYSDNI